MLPSRLSLLLLFCCACLCSFALGQGPPSAGIDVPDMTARTTLVTSNFAGQQLHMPDKWHRILSQKERCILLSPGFLPPVGVSRAHALLAQSHFDALVCYSSNTTQTGDWMKYGFAGSKRPPSERTEDNISEAMAYAAYAVLSDVFAGRTPALNFLAARMAEFGYALPGSEDVSLPSGLGTSLGKAIARAAASDGYNAKGTDAGATSTTPYADTSNYWPVNNAQATPMQSNCPAEIRAPSRWQPLRPEGSTAPQRHLTPHVASARTWALSSGSQFRAPVPPLPTSIGSLAAEWVDQLSEVRGLHSDAAMNDRTKVLAEYFWDGPSTAQPPSHLLVVALLLGKARSLSLADSSALLALVALAMADAGVAAWDSKLYYDSVRPLTAIQCAFSNATGRSWAGPYQGVRLMNMRQWRPYQLAAALTPPFSEYPSGYAVYAGAAMGALRRWFGRDAAELFHTVPAGGSQLEPRITAGQQGFVAGLTDVPNNGAGTAGFSPASDVTLRWSSLSSFAADAAFSRRAGGIHFRAADVEGRRMGDKVAQAVYDKFMTLFVDASSGSGTTAMQPTHVHIDFAGMFNGVTINGVSGITAPN